MQCTSHMHASEQRDAVIQLHSKQRICTCSAFAWMRASGRAGRSMCSLALHTPCVRCDEPWGRPLACSASYSWYRTCRLQAALRHVCRRKRGPRPAFPPSTPLASTRSNLLKRARSYSACYIYPKSVTELRVTCTGHGTLARKFEISARTYLSEIVHRAASPTTTARASAQGRSALSERCPGCRS